MLDLMPSYTNICVSVKLRNEMNKIILIQRTCEKTKTGCILATVINVEPRHSTVTVPIERTPTKLSETTSTTQTKLVKS